MKQEGILDWFTKLFWPKEMKALVAKYEAEGTLNEEAIEYFRKRVQIYNLILITFFLIMILSFKSSNLLVILFMLPFLVKYDLKKQFFRHSFPYQNENKKEALFDKIKIKYAGKQILFYSSLCKRYSYICHIDTKPNLMKKDIPIKGSKVSLYVSKSNGAMPDIEYLKNKYSFTTKIIKS